MITLTPDYALIAIQRQEWNAIARDIIESLCVAMQYLNDEGLDQRSDDLLALVKALGSQASAAHLLDILDDLDSVANPEGQQLTPDEERDVAQALIPWEEESEAAETLDLVDRAKQLRDNIKAIRAEELRCSREEHDHDPEEEKETLIVEPPYL